VQTSSAATAAAAAGTAESAQQGLKLLRLHSSNAAPAPANTSIALPAAPPPAAAAELASAVPAAAAAAAAGVTVITASHFLPHPELPHSRFTELGKAMGCCELQLQLDQVRRCFAPFAGRSHGLHASGRIESKYSIRSSR
jgi:hypothetical protein